MTAIPEIKLDPSQEEAVRLFREQKIGIVTGNPGTGKTSVLRYALAELAQGNGALSVALCAPTGKAARRISEVTNFPAGTIHRTLGAKPGVSSTDSAAKGWSFVHNSRNPLPFSVVIADESSMIDVELASAFLDAIDKSRTRVFFIGDADQLPSIGPGQFFSDLIDSGKVPVARLRHVHRSAQESWIYNNAPKVLQGDIDIKATHDFRWIKAQGLPDIKRTVVDLIARELPEMGVEDRQLLVPQNKGAVGTEQLNLALQEVINPEAPGDTFWTVKTSNGVSYKIRTKDRVIETTNNYVHMVFNGEIGTVMAVANDRMMIQFDDRIVEYTKDFASSLRLAYALTVHKAQGSQHDWVVVVCHSAHSHMWSRQLLYTAITRAKKGVILVGDNKGLYDALSNDKPRRRRTLLKYTLGG